MQPRHFHVTTECSADLEKTQGSKELLTITLGAKEETSKSCRETSRLLVLAQGVYG